MIWYIPTALDAGWYSSNGFHVRRQRQYVRATGLPAPSTWASAASSSGVMTAVACSRKSGSYFRQVSGGVFPSAALTGKKSSVGLRITWYPQFTPDQTARMTTTPATTRIAGGAARIAETARRLHRASGRTDAREGALPARECDMEGMRSLCLSPRTLASLPRLELPVLIPGRLGAHPLAGDRHLDQVRAVVARDPVHAAPERRLELLRGGDALAVHALSAGERDVVGRGGAEIEAGVGAVPHHLAVRDLARPVVSHDLIALVVRDDGEDRRVVPGHRPEPHRAVGEGAIAEVQHDGPLPADGDLGADRAAHTPSERAAAAARPAHLSIPEREQGRPGGRAFLDHDGVPGQELRELRLEHGGMHDRVVLMLAHEGLLALGQEPGVRALLRALAGPARDPIGGVETRQRLAEVAQRLAQLALHRDVERIVAAHEQGVRPDLHHARLGDAAVHALTPDEEEDVRRQAADLLELVGDRIHAAVERMPGRKIREDLPGAEHRRLEHLGQPHGLGLRAVTPDVVAEHHHRAARLTEPPGDRLDRLRARGGRAFDPVLRGLSDLCLQPFSIEELRADGEVDRAGGWGGGLAERARGGDGDGRRVRVHLVRAARLLGDRAHGLGLAQAGKGRESAIILELGRPVPGDHDHGGAGDLGVEELSGELVRAPHHVRDDDADLAADPVVPVRHRGDEPFVLADHEPLVAVLGERREDPGLRGPRVREEVLDARVLQGLEEQHSAGAGDGLAHGLPLSDVVLAQHYTRRIG